MTENHALAGGAPQVPDRLVAAPSRAPLRKRLVGWVIRLAVFAVVILWVLPRFIDYHAVWAAIQHLSVWDLIVLSALSLLRVVTECSIYRAFLRGLRWRTGVRAYLSSDAVGQVLPPPAGSLVLYTYFHSDGIEPKAATATVTGTFIFATLGRFVIWPVAFVLLLVNGTLPERTLIITATSLFVLGVVAAGGYLIVRSEKSARWVGTSVSRLASWVRARFKREPVGDLGPTMVEFRAVALDIFARRWKAASLAVAMNLLVSYLLLLFALRALGVSSSSIGWVDVFGAFALAFWLAAVVPINGSGPGVTDIVMISTLTDVSGVSASVITAAVLIWRLFYSFMPLPFGLFTLSRWRKDNPNVFRRRSAQDGDGQPVATPAPSVEA